MGVELTQAEENGTFGITSAENSYCPSGRFVPRCDVLGIPSSDIIGKHWFETFVPKNAKKKWGD